MTPSFSLRPDLLSCIKQVSEVVSLDWINNQACMFVFKQDESNGTVSVNISVLDVMILYKATQLAIC